MAYRAYLNNICFFDTTLQDEDFFLSYARLNLEAGTAGDFTFRIPPSNAFYDSFNRLTSYVDVYRDDDLIFSGRVFSITEETDTQRQISCEGLLAVLNDSVFRPVTFDGTLRELVRTILSSHNSQVEQDKQINVGLLSINDAEVYRDYRNYETSISRLRDLVASFGGYLYLTKESNGLYLNWTPDFVQGNSQVIELNSNLIKITKTEDSNGIITVLVPVGAADDEGNLTTIESVNAGNDYIVAGAEALAKYGYVVGTARWPDVNVPQILKTKAQNYLNALLVPRITIDLTAADLADAGYDVDAFRVGQKITVKSEPHGLNNVQFNCQDQKLDLLHPESNRLTLGELKEGYVQANSRSSMTDLISELSTEFVSSSMLQLAVESATHLITGNLGGYVILHDSDGDTYPDEILIMDTPDIETAVNVWRFNSSGLGHSSTGYDGTYGLAMTMDGAIVADMITTGTLNADRIRAGILRGQQGDSYWNLVTGELHIGGSGNVDKSKVFINTPTPPYYYGDLWITERSETSAVVGYAVAGYAIAGDDTDGEGGKIMACTYTRTTGTFNADDWHLVTDYIDTSDLQILQQRISAAELNISQNTAEINLRAYTTSLDAFGNRIDTCESEIAMNSRNIELKVSESDVTGNYIVGKINLSSTTATIAASHVDLQGAVTISALSSDAQSKLTTGTEVRQQYYLSTSNTSTTGSSWSNAIPTWAAGKYVWTRTATTKTNAAGASTTTYSTAVYDSNLTSALSNSTSAQSTIAAWCYNNNVTYIDGAKLYTGTVTAEKIAANAVTVGKIADGAVTEGKIGSGAIVETKLANGAVTANKIGASAVTSTKIADSAVTSGKIGSGAVVEAKIAASAVTTVKIADSAITSAKIGSGAVTAAKIGSNAVTEVKLSNGAVTVDKISSGAVTTVKLADGSVTTAKIPSYAITGVKIADNAVVARVIAANAVTANAIAANAVTADAIAAGAVTADKIQVSDLSALGATIAAFTIANYAITSGSISPNNSSYNYGMRLSSNIPFIDFRQKYGGSPSYDRYLSLSANGIEFNLARQGSSSWQLGTTGIDMKYITDTGTNVTTPYMYLYMDGSQIMTVVSSLDTVYLYKTLNISGGLSVSGNKSRVVDTDDYGQRALYCYETPSPMFGDVGEGVIDETGETYIWIDPIFEETVVLKQYQVFLQKYGNGDCYVAERTGSYFIVRGTPGLAFGWELKAKQAGYDQQRLERTDMNYSASESDLGTEAANYVNQIFEGRMTA